MVGRWVYWRVLRLFLGSILLNVRSRVRPSQAVTGTYSHGERNRFESLEGVREK